MMMMMIGDHTRTNPTVQIPQHPYDDPTAHDPALAALQRYLPSNRNDSVFDDDSDGVSSDFDVPVDAYSCDDFRMYEFKVRKCARVRPHDWTECPYAHPGEKARRRDPRRYHYSGTSCPDFRRGACPRGEGCEYAHGVFECWLHPARYRTQPCKDGTHCRRRVCFFAHAPEQLRVLPYGSNNGAVATSPDGSPGRPVAFDLYGGSPPSSPPTTGLSPPMTTGSSPPMSLNSIGHLTASMRSLQLNQMKMGMGVSVSSPMGSPRSPFLRPGFLSLPSTPIRPLARSGLSAFDAWDNISCGEEPLMERVESGRELRERIYSKLGKENSLDRARGEPDVGWVSELLNS